MAYTIIALVRIAYIYIRYTHDEYQYIPHSPSYVFSIEYN